MLLPFICFNSFANIAAPPKFLTKQALEFLRYIDKDGKYTYYQTNSGQLNMTTNYDNTILFQSSKGAHYQIQSSEDGQMLTIELIENFHTQLDFNRGHKIFISKLGDKKLQEVAQGRVPVIASNKQWLGYYTPDNKTIHFRPINIPGKEIELVLNNKVNNFFMPQLMMLNPDTVSYTDINQQGQMAIILYNLTDKKFTTLYKAKFAGTKLEYCLNGNNLVVGEFSTFDVNKGSSFTSIPLFGNNNFTKKDIIYKTTSNDLGNILCKNDKIYFIKTIKYNAILNEKTTEVASLNLKSNELKILTNLKNVTQLISMGERVLVPYRQSFYIIKGDYDTTKQDALESK